MELEACLKPRQMANKQKATFNLSKEILDQLEERFFEIRKLEGTKRITRSMIVEAALRISFKDFGVWEEMSRLFQNLTSSRP